MKENVAREFAERGAAHAKDAYRKTQAAAGETTKVMEQTYSAASKGAADFNLHLLDIAQANMNATFDFARQLTRVTSVPEFFELSTAHVRKQVEALTKQTQDLTHLAQKVTTQAAQPLQTVANKFNQSS
jgi:phasin